MAPTTTPALRPQADRFLLAILIGLGALLLLAGGAVVFSRQSPPALPAGTPGAVVQQFYAALENHDPDTAYNFLSDSMPDKPARAAFVSYNLGGARYGYSQAGDSRRIGPETTRGDVAVVPVVITHYDANPGPFGGAGQWTSDETFTLHRDAEGWRITDLPYQYQP